MGGESKVPRVWASVQPALLARIDRYRERMQAEVPMGVKVTRSDAVRALLELALTAEGLPPAATPDGER